MLDVPFGQAFSATVSLAFFQAHCAWVTEITVIAREKVQPKGNSTCNRDGAHLLVFVLLA